MEKRHHEISKLKKDRREDRPPPKDDVWIVTEEGRRVRRSMLAGLEWSINKYRATWEELAKH